MTIQVYVDESGTAGTDPYFVLAGFMSTAERWAAFSDEWRARLLAPPKIAYLKMNEAAKLKGQFRGWSPAARDKKLELLWPLISEFTDLAIFAIVNVDEFDARIGKLQHDLCSPYMMGCQSILGGVAKEIIAADIRDGLEVFFDEHDIFAPRLQRWYPLIREILKNHSKETKALARVLPMSPHFKSDKEFMPLQAADVFAWLLRMGVSEQPHEFGWLSKSLQVRVSLNSEIINGERMDAVASGGVPMVSDEFLAEKMPEFGIKPTPFRLKKRKIKTR